jgi:hypothetical protein
VDVYTARVHPQHGAEERPMSRLLLRGGIINSSNLSCLSIRVDMLAVPVSDDRASMNDDDYYCLPLYMQKTDSKVFLCSLVLGSCSTCESDLSSGSNSFDVLTETFCRCSGKRRVAPARINSLETTNRVSVWY